MPQSQDQSHAPRTTAGAPVSPQPRLHGTNQCRPRRSLWFISRHYLASSKLSRTPLSGNAMQSRVIWAQGHDLLTTCMCTCPPGYSTPPYVDWWKAGSALRTRSPPAPLAAGGAVRLWEAGQRCLDGPSLGHPTIMLGWGRIGSRWSRLGWALVAGKGGGGRSIHLENIGWVWVFGREFYAPVGRLY